MQIHFIRYKDDDPAEDGIWLLDEGAQFFLNREKAVEERDRRNTARRVAWDVSVGRSLARWEQIEVAYEALIDLGLDPQEVFPYHKRPFAPGEFIPYFVVDSIEAEE